MGVKPNFFSPSDAALPANVMLQIAFANDPKFRASFGSWLYDNFDLLVEEHNTYGRFLTQDELESPLDLPCPIPKT